MKTAITILVALLLIGAALGGGWYLSQKHVVPHSVSGTIETDEVRIASRHGGRVIKLHASEGESLGPGQLVAELEAPELVAQRDQIKALLEELIAGPRREELAAAKHDWESVQAELEFAEAEERRSKELFAQKVISEAERDRAASRTRFLEKSVAAARSRYELLQAGTRPEKIAQAQAQLAEIETRLQELKVAAPGPSVLELLHVKVGDVLAPNREIATLILTNHLWVRVYVPEPWLGFIQPGQPVKARVDSFPEREFPGAVEQINRAAEFTPRNVQTVEERIKQVIGVKIRLSNPDGLLRAGMATDVFFPNVPGAPSP